MGSVLVKEETVVLVEKLRCIVESNKTTHFLMRDQGNFNQKTPWDPGLVTVMRDECTTIVPPLPYSSGYLLCERGKSGEAERSNRSSYANLTLYTTFCFRHQTYPSTSIFVAISCHTLHNHQLET